MRQTNIVWVGFALGTTVMDKFVSQTMPFIKSSTPKPNIKSETYFCYTFKVCTTIENYLFFVIALSISKNKKNDNLGNANGCWILL